MTERGVAAPLALPLNEREEALWMLQRLLPDEGVPNLGLSIEFADHRDQGLVERAACWVVRRHPMLWSSIRLQDGQPVRAFREPHELAVPFEVRTGALASLDDDQRELAARPFDLERDELIRFILFVLPGRQVLLVVVHHLVFDALSTEQFVSDFAAAYDSLASTGAPPDLPAASMPAVSEPARESLDYWRPRTAELTPGAMYLDAADYTATGVSFAGGRYGAAMPEQVAAAVRSLRASTHATENVVLLAAFLALLLRHGAGPELIVGVALNGRPQDQPTAIGPYFSIVPVLVRATAADTFEELVRRTFDQFMESLEHRDVSYEALSRRFGGEGRDWQAPMFRHMFNFWPVFAESASAPAWLGQIRQIDTGHSRYDLEFVLSSGGLGLELQIAYRSDVHDAGFVRRMSDRFSALLLSAAAEPASKLGDLSMATEHDLVIELANKTAARWHGPRTVAGMISSQLRDRPRATAIAAPGGSVSYRQLDQLSQVIGARLEAAGIRAGKVVAVATGRGAVTAAAVLATWHAGAAYLPLDRAHPLDRLRFQLRDSGACALVADRETAGHLADAGCPVILADDLPGTDGAVQVTDGAPAGPAARPAPDPADIAYVIYTSGSTGRPKGVQISHANLANVVSFFRAILEFDSGNKMLWLTTFAFDISALELFLPLSAGGTVVLADDKAQANARLLAGLIGDHDVDVVQATPTTWRMITGLPDVCLAGRWLLCGGEPLPRALAERLLSTGGRLINVYGPTETTIWSTAQPVTGESLGDSSPGIGRPIANTEVAIVSPSGSDCPVDVLGEVVIGGAGVGAGYLRRSDLTAERFVRHDRLGRSYRTGDLGLWRPDGRLELRGRADRQVKVHGGRIELGEVESVLSQHPSVREAAVVVRRKSGIADSIAAFVVPAGDAAAEEVWSFAAQRLPSYAVPSGIAFLAALPVGPSGKTDYVDLAGRAAAEQISNGRARASERPDSMTTWLVELWREMLNRPDAHADSNFFLSGGQSLQAMKVTERIRDHYGIELPALEIFKNPTPRQLSRKCQLTDDARSNKPDRS